jgi:hypothetical protein
MGGVIEFNIWSADLLWRGKYGGEIENTCDKMRKLRLRMPNDI